MDARFFWRSTMIASSVTGVSGPGDSNGKYKPANNCSCSCCCGDNKNETVEKTKKNGCYKKYKICKNFTYKSGNASSRVKTC